ncbi:MAG: dynamin family protein [Gammaproteobacteria bacterium]|nr:dynamin family protein [Gammaproteobacteria bacterium]
METAAFKSQVQAFDDWKDGLAKNLESFRLWLRRNQLFQPETDLRLYHMLETLRSDYLTIAFVGEFSRGKTELINAIFFSEYGQRILPSDAGRTTMCPTELFFDRDSKLSYIRLLPIETRLKDIALADYKTMPGHWVELPLITNSAADMAQAMATITQTKRVSFTQAVALGFDKETLSKSKDPDGYVAIPAWRHALISFPHPLLSRGLCILDTPGLNALGSEPELTLSLLPKAQAIVFVLAADTGVTASDMAIWEEHIAQLKSKPNLGVYAVLNKIDSLWDELEGEKRAESSLQRILELTGRQLQLQAADVLPVSAQKGLLAKVRQDQGLLAKTRLGELEKILSEALLGNKQQALWESVVRDAGELLTDNARALEKRRDQLSLQRNEIERARGISQHQLAELLEQNQSTLAEYKKRILSLKPSQRLMERQTRIMLGHINPGLMNQKIEQTRHELVGAWTTIGMHRVIHNFFDSLEAVMSELMREAELSNKMAESIYRKFQEEHQMELLAPKLIVSRRYQRQLQLILQESQQFNESLVLTLSEQSFMIRRFFATTVSRTLELLNTVRRDLIHWSQSVMSPLLQQLHEQRDLIDRHVQDLGALQQDGATAAGRLRALNTLVLELDQELAQGRFLASQLTPPVLPASVSPSNVVDLARLRR